MELNGLEEMQWCNTKEDAKYQSTSLHQTGVSRITGHPFRAVCPTPLTHKAPLSLQKFSSSPFFLFHHHPSSIQIATNKNGTLETEDAARMCTQTVLTMPGHALTQMRLTGTSTPYNTAPVLDRGITASPTPIGPRDWQPPASRNVSTGTVIRTNTVRPPRSTAGTNIQPHA